jgi:hypothetical protein
VVVRPDHKGPIVALDIDISGILERAARTLAEELGATIDSGGTPSGEAAIPLKASTVRVKQYLGPGPRGHRTGQMKLAWRARRIKKGKHAGEIIVDLPRNYREALYSTLGAKAETVSQIGPALLAKVNASITKAVEAAIKTTK